MTDILQPLRRGRHAAGARATTDPVDPFRSVAFHDSRAASHIERILAVCTGNVCRSPVIERLLGFRLRAAGRASTVVESAGIQALAGRDMEPASRAILERHGAPWSGFVSRSIHDLRLTEFDLILTASESHRRAIVELEPSVLTRTHPLCRFARSPWSPAGPTDDHDITDPYRKSLVHYQEMELQIVPAVDAVAAILVEYPCPEP